MKNIYQCWIKTADAWYVQNHEPFHTKPLQFNAIYLSYGSDTKSLLLHQGDLTAETTIQWYKEPPQCVQGYIPEVTIIQPTTKVEHPFDV